MHKNVQISDPRYLHPQLHQQHHIIVSLTTGTQNIPK